MKILLRFDSLNKPLFFRLWNVIITIMNDLQYLSKFRFKNNSVNIWNKVIRIKRTCNVKVVFLGKFIILLFLRKKEKTHLFTFKIMKSLHPQKGHSKYIFFNTFCPGLTFDLENCFLQDQLTMDASGNFPLAWVIATYLNCASQISHSKSNFRTLLFERFMILHNNSVY